MQAVRSFAQSLSRRERYGHGLLAFGFLLALSSLTFEHWVAVSGTFDGGAAGTVEYSYRVGLKVTLRALCYLAHRCLACAQTYTKTVGGVKTSGTLKSPGADWLLARFYPQVSRQVRPYSYCR